MWKISEAVCLLIMIYVSIQDIKIRKVSVYLLVVAGVGCMIYQTFTGQMNVCLILGGTAIGAAFVLISKVTGEGIGYGDSLGILILGMFLGLWRVMTVLSITFLLLLCVLIPVMWKKKMSRKITLPFYPFLTGGYLCLLVVEGFNI